MTPPEAFHDGAASGPKPRPPAEASGWTVRGLARAAAIAAVALGSGAGLGYAVAHEPIPESPGTRPQQPERVDPERAMLAPLHEGSTLLGFDLAEVHPIGDDGVLRIVGRREHATVRIEVALAKPGEPTPGEPKPGEPAPTLIAGRYAVTFAVENAAPADGARLAEALAAVLRANTAPPPPRLRPFAGQR